MRGRISSKSNTYTESLFVYAAGISVKVSVHYPGRSGFPPLGLFPSRGGEKEGRKSAEVIVTRTTTREGLNFEERRNGRCLIETEENRKGESPRTPRIGTESRRQANVWRTR